MNSLAWGTFINLGTRIAAIGLGLSITVLTARIGTEAQGQFALFTSIESLLLTLFSGFGVALARRVSHLREDAGGAVAATVLACLTLGAGCAAALTLVSMVSRDTYALLWILAIGGPVLLLPANLPGVWLGQGRMAPMGIVTVMPSLLTLVFFAGFWWLDPVLAPNKIFAMLVSWAAAKLVVGLGLLVVFQAGSRSAADWGALKADGRFILTIGVTNVIGLLNYRVDLFLVEHFVGLSATGVYSISVMVAELLWLLSSALTQASYARIGTADRDAAGRFVARIVHANLIGLALLAPLLLVAATLILPILLGPGYEGVPLLVAVLLPGVLSYGAASPLSAYFTNHAGLPRVPAMVAGLSLVLNVACCFVLVPRIGSLGGAAATTISYLLSVVVMMALFVRHSGIGARALLRPDVREVGRAMTLSLASMFRRRAS